MSGDLAIRVELTVDDFWRPYENGELLRNLWLRSCVVYRHPSVECTFARLLPLREHLSAVTTVTPV